MVGLMQICRNWGSSECSVEVAGVMVPREAQTGESAVVWPSGMKLEQLDEYCRSCPKRYFKAESDQCLVCDGGRLEPSALSQIKFTSGTEYLYECPECATNYYAYHELE